jgi:MYXO-CTERM domain-containing protein
MDGRKSLGLLGLVGGALLLNVLGACAAPTDDPSNGSASSVTKDAFDRNAVLDDKSLRDPDTITSADIQKFLEKTPWGTRSALATYTEGGKTAAEIMATTAQAHGINPLELVVRAQMEQGLISKTTATAATIAIAFGCGCPESSVCSDKYRGLANQAECAAGTLRRAMDGAATSKGSVSGWTRNKAKDTEDGITVTPKNAATAALYTYTPWVGEAGGGRKGVGGASLHAQVWDRFAESFSYGEWADTTTTTEDPDAGSATPDAATETETDAAPPPPPPVDEDAGTDPGDPGDPDPGADAGSEDPGVDAAPPPSSDIPDDGSDDGVIIGEGSAPPADNAAPPSSGRTHPEELPEATAEELSPKKASVGGCSTTGQSGSSNGMLIACAAGVALIGSRRRRRAASR